MVRCSVIKGYGSYLPERILTNYDLEKIVDTNDEWITTRTGIKKRHIAAESELTSEMALKASLEALKIAGIDKEQIDLIIVATTTPDNTFPSTATKLQSLLGIRKGAAFDVQAVCAGFIYALNIADMFIKTNQADNVLVVGADKMSSVLDWQDRATCVLFGDGAGAIIVRGEESSDPKGVIANKICSDGDYGTILYTDGGVASTGVAGKLRMLGPEVFKHAVEKMSTSIVELLASNNYIMEDVDVLIPHQANIRILEAVAKRINLPKEKVISTVSKHANTSAATIPLALVDALSENRIRSGDLIVLSAIGGGLCWGSSLIRW